MLQSPGTFSKNIIKDMVVEDLVFPRITFAIISIGLYTIDLCFPFQRS